MKMSYKYKIEANEASTSLESWGAGLAGKIQTQLEKSFSEAKGKLAHMQIGNENFGDTIARKAGIDSATVHGVLDRVDEFFRNNKFIMPGCESLSRSSENPNPHRSLYTKTLGSFEAEDVLSIAEESLRGFPRDTILSTTKEIAAAISKGEGMRQVAFEGLKTEPVEGLQSLYDNCGARAFGHFTSGATGMRSLEEAVTRPAVGSTESFGATINDLNVNTRLAVAVSILRNFSSTIDKLFLRVTDETNTVIMTIPNPTVFSLERMNYHTSDIRNDPRTEVALVNLHAEPGMVNTDPQPVMPNINIANDTDPQTKYIDEVAMPGQKTLIAHGKEANLLDLTANSNRMGFENANHTDSIAEGGTIKTLIIAAKSNNTTEYFALNIAGLPGSRFITLANNSDSSETIVNLTDLPLPIVQNSLTTAGTPTKIFTSLGKANIQLTVSFTAALRLKYCDIRGSGSVKFKITPAGGVSEQSAASDMTTAQTLAASTEFSVYAYLPELYFNEENLRKTVVSARVNWLQRAFQIPQGKNFTVDTALDQGKEEAAIETVQTAMSIGNSDRGMSVLESRMEETADILETAQAQPEVYRTNRLQNLSYAGTLCRPYVLRATADYNQLNVAVMRESERLTDRHAKMSQILLNGLANVISRSLYNTSMNAGERVVFKALMHSVTADLLFGIPSYHPALEDAVPKANGSDYSFVLDNGIRIDVVKTNFHSWQGKIAIVPVREDDPGDILSFATIRDRGVFAGTVPGANYDGATVIRDVVNSREFLLVTNPIGMILSVDNIAADLGQLNVIDAV